jgi:hypothetical protein
MFKGVIVLLKRKPRRTVEGPQHYGKRHAELMVANVATHDHDIDRPHD